MPHSRSVFSSMGQRRSWVRQASGTASPAELSLVTRSSCCHSSWHLTARLCSPGLMDLFGAFTGAELERDNMGGGLCMAPSTELSTRRPRTTAPVAPRALGDYQQPPGGHPLCLLSPQTSPFTPGDITGIRVGPTVLTQQADAGEGQWCGAGAWWQLRQDALEGGAHHVLLHMKSHVNPTTWGKRVKLLTLRMTQSQNLGREKMLSEPCCPPSHCSSAHRCLRCTPRHWQWESTPFLLLLMGLQCSMAQPHQLSPDVEALWGNERKMKDTKSSQGDGRGAVRHRVHLAVVDIKQCDAWPCAQPGLGVAGDFGHQWLPLGAVGETLECVQRCLVPLLP